MTGRTPPALGQVMAGCVVLVTADRRSGELASALTRRGATVRHAPALTIVPHEHDEELVLVQSEIWLGEDGELPAVDRMTAAQEGQVFDGASPVGVWPSRSTSCSSVPCVRLEVPKSSTMQSVLTTPGCSSGSTVRRPRPTIWIMVDL